MRNLESSVWDKKFERDRMLIVDELNFKHADFEQIAYKTFDYFLKPM